MKTPHRQSKRVDGKTVHVGSFMLDKRYNKIRIKKSSGFNDIKTFNKFLECLQELSDTANLEAIEAFRDGKVTPTELMLYNASPNKSNKPWDFNNNELTQALTAYLDAVPHAITKLGYTKSTNGIRKLITKGNDRISALPSLLVRYKSICLENKTPSQFNHTRAALLGFVASRVKRNHDIYQSIKDTPKLAIRVNRERHNPFTPQEIDNLFVDDPKNIFKEILFFMCLTGFRPKEFLDYGYIKHHDCIEILGEKTRTSHRFVPLVVKQLAPNPQLLNLNYQRLRALFVEYCPKHTPYDCRRSFKVWCKKAKIPSDQIDYYMGHSSSVKTLYSIEDARQNWVRPDARLLSDYVLKQRAHIPEVEVDTTPLLEHINDLSAGDISEKKLSHFVELINDHLLKMYNDKTMRRRYVVPKLFDVTPAKDLDKKLSDLKALSVSVHDYVMKTAHTPS